MKLWCLFVFSVFSLVAAEDITGFWKRLDENGSPQCVFAVYEHEGIYYGRIIGTYDDDGQMKDTIYKPISRVNGVAGNPYKCGLDILYGLQENSWRFVGKIIDPTKGNIYNCEVWVENGNLIFRGKVLMFGRNETWYPVTKEDFPKGFKLPDTKTFVPSIPQPS